MALALIILASLSYVVTLAAAVVAIAAKAVPWIAAHALAATLLIPNVGEELVLKNFLNIAAAQDQKLVLFKSNTTPAETDTTATYTAADFTGYADAAITGSSWTTTQGAPSHADYAQQTFTSSAAQATQNIYGYLLKQTTSGTLMLAERFSDGPYPITNNGDAIKITPVVTAD